MKTPLWLFDTDGQARTSWGFRLGFAVLLVWPLAALPLSGAAIWVGLAGAGAALAMGGQLYMGRSWRIGAAEGKTGALVTGGPFRVSRNPVFVGQILLFWSLVPLAGPVMAGAAVVVTVSAIVQVRIVERVLMSDPAWQGYAARTRRWIGRRA